MLQTTEAVNREQRMAELHAERERLESRWHQLRRELDDIERQHTAAGIEGQRLGLESRIGQSVWHRWTGEGFGLIEMRDDRAVVDCNGVRKLVPIEVLTSEAPSAPAEVTASSDSENAEFPF